MFTGIIRGVGRIRAMTPSNGDLRMTVSAGTLPWRGFAAGESIAVNGVCLTADRILDDGFECDVSRKSLEVTAFGDLAEGSAVNLEPSVALGERLGGHLVTGHVDCVGRLLRRTMDARSIRLDVELPRDHAHYVARKGSVCVDGVSLTVNDVSATGFSVNIIPHTAAHTIIDGYTEGVRVNIEVDLIMRYVERLVDAGRGATARTDGVSRDLLEAQGYV